MLSCEVRRAGDDVERCRAISEYRNLLKCTSNSSVNRHSNNTYYWKMAQSVVHGLYHFVHHVLLHCYQRFPVEQNGSDCRQAIHYVVYRRQAIAAILFYHGLQGSAGTVLTVITLSYGKWRNSTPHRIKTPSLVDMKLWIYDYVREICPQIYFCKNPCSGGFWREWWNITSQIFIYISTFFSQNRLQVTPVDRCSHAVAQKTWNHSRKCLLGVRTLKLILTFYIIAKTVEFLAKTGLFST